MRSHLVNTQVSNKPGSHGNQRIIHFARNVLISGVENEIAHRLERAKQHTWSTCVRTCHDL